MLKRARTGSYTTVGREPQEYPIMYFLPILLSRVKYIFDLKVACQLIFNRELQKSVNLSISINIKTKHGPSARFIGVFLCSKNEYKYSLISKISKLISSTNIFFLKMFTTCL